MTADPLAVKRVQLREHMNILNRMADDWIAAADACCFAARMMGASMKDGKG